MGGLLERLEQLVPSASAADNAGLADRERLKALEQLLLEADSILQANRHAYQPQRLEERQRTLEAQLARLKQL